MRALVYGHSQSGGMGLDFVKLLKKQGYDVERVTKNGWSDKQLKGGIPELTGDPAGYARIVYFAGANPKGQSREVIAGTILENAATMGGPSKVLVVLAPYNQAKEPPGLLTQTDTRGWLYEQQLRKAGYKVYRPLLPEKVFWPDQVHVKPYTAEGLELAADALAGKPNRFCLPPPAKYGLVLGLAAGALGLVLARRLRRRT